MDNVFLLIKYYQGKTTKEESVQVSQWLRDNDENQKAYEEFVRIWYHSSRTGELLKIDPQKTWESIRKETFRGKTRQLKILHRVASVAAVLIVCFLVYLMTLPKSIIAYNQTKGSNEKVQLPDSTIVILNYMGQIEYPARFTRNKREVLFKGHAFFNVKKDVSRPFTIKAHKSIVQVLGTSFDYFASDSATRVYVATGKVSLTNLIDTSQHIFLLPGELGELMNGDLTKKKNIDKNILSWKTGIYNFKNTPLSEVFTKLEERFHTSFSYSLNDVEQKFITVSFSNNSLEEILEVLQFTCSVKFIIKPNIIYVQPSLKN